ncbi:MAG: hypothetical protein JPMHGGIA_02233 [Saprospiraceae bacterium]|nr:polysaccharide deacetylase family protein [Saprospiraceae bacterium]MBV6473935.1 hypothetical protein [Saprospiraceae bacterium]
MTEPLHNNASTRIFVYAVQPGARLQYLLNYLNRCFAKTEFVLCSDEEAYKCWEGPSIQRGTKTLKERELHIPQSPQFTWPLEELLAGLTPKKIDRMKGLEGGEDAGFDPMAAAFWHLSRLEEYLPGQRDQHGRFAAAGSALGRHHLLQIPMVDRWVESLAQEIQSRYGVELQRAFHSPSWSIGIDVDQFFKYQHKSPLRTMGGMLRDLWNSNGDAVRQRAAVLWGSSPDPFDRFDAIRSTAIPYGHCKFFILSGGKSAYDKNHDLGHPAVAQILKQLQNWAEVGLHPSYSSYDAPPELFREKLRLDRCLNNPATISRQHFLRLSVPESYRRLLEAGITSDYSMGYPELPGFRAGTCRPYPWYDLGRDRATPLMVHPLVCMDRSYLDYLQWDPGRSVADMLALRECCQRHGGHFHLVWHNSSFDFENEWHGWQGVFEELVGAFTTT